MGAQERDSAEDYTSKEKRRLRIYFLLFSISPFESYYFFQQKLFKMSDAEWDADDFEPKTSNLEAERPKTDKWGGEDEDDDVKDSWDKESDDDDDTSKGSEDSNSMKAVQRKKKK